MAADGAAGGIVEAVAGLAAVLAVPVLLARCRGAEQAGMVGITAARLLPTLPRAGRGSGSGGWLLCEGFLWCYREIMCPTGLTSKHRHCYHHCYILHLFEAVLLDAQAEPPSLNPN